MQKELIPNTKDYFITSCGKVFKGNNELKKNYSHAGYRTVSLKHLDGSRKLYYVHRVVAQVFITNPDNKPVVNHKNLIKADNRVKNLEWVTYKENNQHAHDNGAFRVGGSHHKSLYEVDQIRSVCLMIQEGRRNKEISELTGVHRATISEIRKGKQWQHISKDYVLVKSRVRRFSDITVKWICSKIVEGLRPIDIHRMSEGKVPVSTIKDIKAKKSYRDISVTYF
jgi:hypothetical protein